jgi:hypothetical protein
MTEQSDKQEPEALRIYREAREWDEWIGKYILPWVYAIMFLAIGGAIAGGVYALQQMSHY